MDTANPILNDKWTRIIQKLGQKVEINKWHQGKQKQLLIINPVTPNFHWVKQIALALQQPGFTGSFLQNICVFGWI